MYDCIVNTQQYRLKSSGHPLTPNTRQGAFIAFVVVFPMFVHGRGCDRECVRHDYDDRSHRMKVTKEYWVRCSGSVRGIWNGRSGSTPGSDHPLIRAPVEELQQGRRFVAPRSPPRLRTTLKASFPILCPRAEAASDVAIPNRGLELPKYTR